MRFILDVQTGEYLAVGSDGWALWERNNGIDTRLMFQRANGRWLVWSLSLGSQTVRPLGAESIRDVPFGRVERFVNAPAIEPTFAAATVIRNRILAPPLAKGGVSYQKAVATAMKMPTFAPQLKMNMPAVNGRTKPDSFYEMVGNAHAFASLLGRGGAEMLASANGVPVSTVYRWLREGRRRGVIAPARR